jgi:FtsH-binding integral membrane protein
MITASINDNVHLMRNVTSWSEWLGWYGVIAILAAYALTSFQVVSPVSFVAAALNLTGALGLAVNGFHKQDWPAAVLNFVWFGIAGVTLGRILAAYAGAGA